MVPAPVIAEGKSGLLLGLGFITATNAFVVDVPEGVFRVGQRSLQAKSRKNGDAKFNEKYCVAVC